MRPECSGPFPNWNLFHYAQKRSDKQPVCIFPLHNSSTTFNYLILSALSWILHSMSFIPRLVTGNDLLNELLVLIPNLETPHADLIWFNKEEEIITVETLRTLDEHFLLPPFQLTIKTVILHRLDLANETIQNMLLKKLEEPPTWLQLYITAVHPHSLLPTILSRVQQLNPTTLNESTTNQQLTTSQLANKSIDQLIKFAEQLKERNQAIDAILSLLQEHVEMLQQTPSLNIISNIRRLTKTLTLLHANTNVRLSIEWCLFGLKRL